MGKTGLAERKKNRSIEIVMHNALHFFEENGYDSTTIEQLCDAAMISQSTFFNYFGTKEKIVELVMRDGLKDCYEYREKLLAENGDTPEAARKMLMFICAANEKYCNTVSVFHRIALQRQEFRDIEEEHNALGARMVEAAFESAGTVCPFSTETLKVLLGGCFADPFLTLPPKEACERTRQSISELLDHLFK
ncbi:MAG: TetR/AcrR family transcriptional regulator [Mogibacterium sp.]|nr:TetR/AcrR family transcriptional regulator [Mogibacterium sp.]